MPINPKQAEVLLQQLQVLVVDDSSFMRAIVRNLLNNIGVKSVIEAGDGIAALEKIREETPDVVILDWEMPLLNGPELVRIVRSPGGRPGSAPISMVLPRNGGSTADLSRASTQRNASGNMPAGRMRYGAR